MYIDCVALVQMVRLSPLLGERRLIVWLCQSPIYCHWRLLLNFRTSLRKWLSSKKMEWGWWIAIGPGSLAYVTTHSSSPIEYPIITPPVSREGFFLTAFSICLHALGVMYSFVMSTCSPPLITTSIRITSYVST